MTDNDRIIRAILHDGTDDNFITKLLRARKTLGLHEGAVDKCRGHILTGYDGSTYRCASCDTEVSKNDKFCKECGNRL